MNALEVTNSLSRLGPRPWLLDLFCKAGGAGTGYQRSGFATLGIDIEHQDRYPFEFLQLDALDVLADPSWWPFLDAFDAVHASPPCQAYTSLSVLPAVAANQHPDLVPPVREGLEAWARRTGGLWIMENVPGAPLQEPLVLCGTEFGLGAQTAVKGRVWLRRHRLFESNALLMGAGGCHCGAYRGRIIGVYGHGDGGGRGWKGSFSDRKAAMGIDWMTREELAQAIPPAYTDHLGVQLRDQLRVRKEAA